MYLFLYFSGKYKSDDKKKWDKTESMEVDAESGAASGAESTLSSNAADDDNTPKVDPTKWTVSIFIFNLLLCCLLSIIITFWLCYIINRHI